PVGLLYPSAFPERLPLAGDATVGVLDCVETELFQDRGGGGDRDMCVSCRLLIAAALLGVRNADRLQRRGRKRRARSHEESQGQAATHNHSHSLSRRSSAHIS